MAFPAQRLRRLRKSAALRRLVRECTLTADDLLWPLFVGEGEAACQPINSLPGQFRLSVEAAAEEAARAFEQGIPAVMLFAALEEQRKDALGAESWNPRGLICRAISEVKRRAPGLGVVADACFCQFTTHGHCGVLNERGEVDNDVTLANLKRQARAFAQAGADVIAPSGMMDGAVGAIRAALDEAGFQEVAIMGYSAKYSSGFYGPFREAAGSAPSFGDRSAYQMDPYNAAEALREVELDLAEGADIVMVKPGLAYLDVLYRVKERFGAPTAVYNVSGEYAMVEAAARNGWLEKERVVLEMMAAFKRAGADFILTYWAPEIARWLG